MKKIVLTLSLGVLLAGFSYSQKTTKGTKMASGTIGLTFNTEKRDDGTAITTRGKYSAINMNPNVGYFIMDGLAVGGGINIATSNYKRDGSADKLNTTSLAFAPFARYYTDMGLFGHVSVSLGSGKEKDTQDNGGGNVTVTETNFGLFGFEFGGGYAYFLNDNVAVEPMLIYGSNSIKDKTAAPNTKEIHGGIQFRIGISVFL
ncbi:MAG: hypothetical protein OEX22_05065 [Cyclobacteriaceae bacterium]|nr:hypothetical protein [Cyclobacteriaceae bacterium]